MARAFSLAYLTIPGTAPVDHIQIASEAGYDYVSLRTIPMHLPNEPLFMMEDNADLFKATRQALKDCGMKLLDIELARVREDLDITTYEKAFEKGAELDATDVLSSIWSKDTAFSVDQCGRICEMAAKYSLTVNLEFVTFAGVTDLKGAVEILDQVKADNLKIMVDTVHAHRSFVPVSDLAAVPKEKYGFIHLCDCPGPVPALDDPEMIFVAREGRLYLGEGGADIAGMLKALPANPCSIELPNSARTTELGVAGHAKRCLETAKAYFKQHNID